MVTIQTDLSNLKEPARRERFEPTGNRRRTQGAIQQVYTVAAGKVAQVGMARLPVAAASINILNSDIEFGIDSGSAATTLTLSPNNRLEHDAVQIDIRMLALDWPDCATPRWSRRSSCSGLTPSTATPACPIAPP